VVLTTALILCRGVLLILRARLLATLLPRTFILLLLRLLVYPKAIVLLLPLLLLLLLLMMFPRRLPAILSIPPTVLSITPTVLSTELQSVLTVLILTVLTARVIQCPRRHF
jgi:hypothetical protein